MDWMYANCSTTAQRGALDWKDRFRDAVAPVYDDLYQSVVTGEETRITLSQQRSRLQREAGSRTQDHARLRDLAGRQDGAFAAPEIWKQS